MGKNGKNGKNGKPSREDAEIILKLAELSALMNTQAGAELIWLPDFDAGKYPPGTHEHTGILQLMRWMETIGTLYRNGLVNEDLLFDWLGITGTWDKVKPIALAIREHTVPSMWENFEYMAERQREWKPKR
jgi:hypothetical protein